MEFEKLNYYTVSAGESKQDKIINFLNNLKIVPTAYLSKGNKIMWCSFEDYSYLIKNNLVKEEKNETQD